MSGTRLFNFREGDRSEYLANYLLSGLGLVTPVPRQEDIGFDFYCQLADQETGNLTFGYPFIVQVKSDGNDKIIYGNTNAEKWKPENINWLFRLELPFFIGVVNRKEMKISIYNTSALHFIFFENPTATVLELVPRVTYEDGDIHRPAKTKIENWPADKGDGYKYVIDLGNPIITITNDDIYNPEILTARKTLLRTVVMLEQQNQSNRSFFLPHFYWTLKTHTNDKIIPAWIYLAADNKKALERLYRFLGAGLISLAMNIKASGQVDLALQLKPFLKNIPKYLIYKNLKDQHPDLFD